MILSILIATLAPAVAALHARAPRRGGRGTVTDRAIAAIQRALTAGTVTDQELVGLLRDRDYDEVEARVDGLPLPEGNWRIAAGRGTILAWLEGRGGRGGDGGRGGPPPPNGATNQDNAPGPVFHTGAFAAGGVGVVQRGGIVAQGDVRIGANFEVQNQNLIGADALELPAEVARLFGRFNLDDEDINDAGHAGNNAGRAGNEAGRAGNEAGRAGNEAGRAGNDAGRAGNDAGRAGNDAGRAGNDAGRAGNDAGRAGNGNDRRGADADAGRPNPEASPASSTTASFLDTPHGSENGDDLGINDGTNFDDSSVDGANIDGANVDGTNVDGANADGEDAEEEEENGDEEEEQEQEDGGNAQGGGRGDDGRGDGGAGGAGGAGAAAAAVADDRCRHRAIAAVSDDEEEYEHV